MKKVIVLILLFGAASIQAAPVVYAISGTLNVLVGSDSFGIDGANFVYTIYGDTDAVITNTLVAGTTFLADYDADYAEVSFANRPGGLPDNVSQVVSSNFQTRNSAFEGNLDSVWVGTAAGIGDNSRGTIETGEMAGLNLGGFAGSVADLWPGLVYGAIPLNLGPNYDSSSTDNGWKAVDSSVFYEQTNVSMTANAVPIPSAVWLFGSGLLGLIGIARRRKAS